MTAEEVGQWCDVARACIAEIGHIQADAGVGEQSVEEQADQEAAKQWLPEVSQTLVALKLQRATRADLQ